MGSVFQSTPSAWRETFRFRRDCRLHRAFQSTPSAWRETNIEQQERESKLFQSTPSAWRETITPDYFFRRFYISIHSLRMEGDSTIGVNAFKGIPFQSTPSAWRETRTANGTHEDLLHFNPLPPHGGRHGLVPYQIAEQLIFQSTPSAWRETPVAHSGQRT